MTRSLLIGKFLILIRLYFTHKIICEKSEATTGVWSGDLLVAKQKKSEKEEEKPGEEYEELIYPKEIKVWTNNNENTADVIKPDDTDDADIPTERPVEIKDSSKMEVKVFDTKANKGQKGFGSGSVSKDNK